MDHDAELISLNKPRAYPVGVMDKSGQITWVSPQANCLPPYLEQTGGTKGRPIAYAIQRDFEEQGWRLIYSEYEGVKDEFQKAGMLDERQTFADMFKTMVNGGAVAVRLNVPLSEMNAVGECNGKIYPYDLLPPCVQAAREKSGEYAAKGWEPPTPRSAKGGKG